jgi:hypothetical protein
MDHQQQSPLLIEINGHTHELITGRIKIWRSQPNPTHDYGYIVAEGIGRDIHFKGDAFCRIEAGVSHPRSAGPIERARHPVTAADKGKFIIHPNTKVVLLRPTNTGVPFTTMVGVARYHDMALEQIGSRQIYRVRHIKGRNAGVPMKDSVYETGTAVELQQKFPRLTENDPLAPIYRTKNITGKGHIIVRSEWQRKDGQTWVTCDDPRPFPEGMTKRLFRIWKIVNPVADVAGSEIKTEQMWSGHFGSLLELHRHDFLGKRFYVEGSRDGINWAEVADPRLPVEDDTVVAVKAAPEPERDAPDVPNFTRREGESRGFPVGETATFITKK